MKSSMLRSSLNSSVIKSNSNPQTRRKFWLEITGAMYEMSYNSLYYYRLLQDKAHHVSKYTKQIDRDLHRTFPEEPYFKSPHSFEILKNILIAYSFRNPNVGYCQGMNFIAGRFLTLGFSEVESFWLLVQVIEKYLPFEYFSTMSGVMIDQKVFDFLLRTRLQKVAKVFDRLEMNSSLITVQWFICIYAYTFQTEVVARIWDEIFIHGYTVMYKISLAVFWLAQKEIQKKTELTEVFQCVEKKCKEISDPEAFIAISNRKLFRVNHFLLERIKQTATKEVKRELSERYHKILTEEEILMKINCLCENEDVCRQKNDLTTGFFTFLTEDEIKCEEEYLDGEEYDRKVDLSLVREAKNLMVGIKNHVCGIDEPEDLERVHNTNVRSSFMVIADDIRDLDDDMFD